MTTEPTTSTNSAGETEATPHIVRYTLLSCQMCMPKWMTDKDALKKVEELNECGTTGGWILSDIDIQRVPCEKYAGNVHMLFDC